MSSSSARERRDWWPQQRRRSRPPDCSSKRTADRRQDPDVGRDSLQSHACHGQVGHHRAYGEQGKFLHSALAAPCRPPISSSSSKRRVPTKVEETGKIFPVSNRAPDVLEALLGCSTASGHRLLWEPYAIEPSRRRLSLNTNQRENIAAKVIVTVGGQSYPGSGTTGDGYAWRNGFGHTIVPRTAGSRADHRRQRPGSRD